MIRLIPDELLIDIFHCVFRDISSVEDEAALTRLSRVSRDWYRLIKGDVLPRIWRWKIDVAYVHLFKMGVREDPARFKTTRQGSLCIEERVTRAYIDEFPVAHLPIPPHLMRAATLGTEKFLCKTAGITITFEKSQFSASYLIALFRALDQTNITALHLVSCTFLYPIGLEQGLIEAKRLERFTLCDPHGPDVFRQFFSAIGKNCCLKYVIVRTKNLPPDALLQLKTNTHLERLTLFMCHLGITHMDDLSMALVENCTLRSLDIRDASMCDDFLKVLFSRRNVGLKSVVLKRGLLTLSAQDVLEHGKGRFESLESVEFV